MFLPYHIMCVLGVAATLTAAWSVAPVGGAASVDMEVIKLAQGLRTPTETSVSSTVELEAALTDPSIDAIVMQDGVYNLTATLEIKRSVSIRAASKGKAVLDGCGSVRVLSIDTSGTVNLAGLQITGGYTYDSVRCGSFNLTSNIPQRPLKAVSRNMLLQGGGVYIDGSSTVNFEDCGIYSNSAYFVGSIYLNLSWNVPPSPP